MMWLDVFPDNAVTEVDIHKAQNYEVMIIRFENGDHVNLYLSEDGMTNTLHKFDEAKERWLKNEAVQPVHD